MILNTADSANCTASDTDDFERLLDSSKKLILSDKSTAPQDLKGRNFEAYLFERLQETSTGTKFADKFELVSGLYFPDIIACGYFGIEAKTIASKSWKTTGNSVFESTRIEGIEKIYMYCAQLTDTIDIRYKNYADCLIDIAVTHSPRYLVNMEADSQTIFAKMKIGYDDFRRSENPIQFIRDYYKSQMKPGDVWWMDEDKSNQVIIRYWNNLSRNERYRIVVEAFCKFPELFSRSNDKYANLVKWLLEDKSVICSNIRDVFTAGGQQSLQIGGRVIKLPRIYSTLYQYRKDIADRLGNELSSWCEEVRKHDRTLTAGQLHDMLTD